MAPHRKALMCFAAVLWTLGVAAKDSNVNALFSRHDRRLYESRRAPARQEIPDGDDLEAPGGNERQHDDPQGCTLFGGESAIPRSGLGMYTTTSHLPHTFVGLPEVGIPLIDLTFHVGVTRDRRERRRRQEDQQEDLGEDLEEDLAREMLLTQYPWGARQLVSSDLEVLEDVLEDTQQGAQQGTQQDLSGHYLTMRGGLAESMTPSLGMLANSHLGLKSCAIDEGKGGGLVQLGGTSGYVGGEAFLQKNYQEGDAPHGGGNQGGQSRQLRNLAGYGTGGWWDSQDAGRGASSEYFNVFFRANGMGIPIPEQTKNESAFAAEIFVDYGQSWFASREKTTLGGVLIPFEEHFEEADEILENFVRWRRQAIGEHCPDADEQCQRKEETHYKNILDNAKHNEKLHMVLPKHASEVSQVLQLGGTARFSVPDSLRSRSWMDQNAFCMDNLYMGRSVLPQAGNGAFASRFLEEGSVVATTPVITIHRDHLLMYDETFDGEDENEAISHQLLLNYCFGHANSSLLMFPYTSTVHFINHGNTETTSKNKPFHANVKLRWSTTSYHQHELLHQSLHDIHSRLKTGLVLDIVATRNIHLGEEILLDYGNDWLTHWKQHVRQWDVLYGHDQQKQSVIKASLPSPSALRKLNSDQTTSLRTVEEQLLNPYPDHIQTVCYYSPPDIHEDDDIQLLTEADSYFHSGNRYSKQYKSLWKFIPTSESYPCSILSRDSYTVIQNTADNEMEDAAEAIKKGHVDFYTARMLIRGKIYVATRIPRYGIAFIEKPYRSNQHLTHAFRHFIGIPKDMMPDHWLDR